LSRHAAGGGLTTPRHRSTLSGSFRRGNRYFSNSLISMHKLQIEEEKEQADISSSISECMNACRLECKITNPFNYVTAFKLWLDENINLHNATINKSSYLYSDNTISYININQVTKNEFQANYEIPSIPVMITNIMDEWKCSCWDLNYLSNQSIYRNRSFKYGESELGEPYKLQLNHYIYYLHNNVDDSPLYLFDNSFEDDDIASNLVNEYTIPHYFDEDYFSVFGPIHRPPYRWLLIGPERSGSSLHIDPLSTSAWNSLIFGYKLWLLFPSTINKSLIQLILGKLHIQSQDGEDSESINYFIKILPRIRSIIREEGIKHNGNDLGMLSFIQKPGETLFIPCNYW
jgi:histone arginine demethylase JMJD6